MIKKAIIIFGPPGSGKGTQAELLAKRFHFIHFDTGSYIEKLVNAPGWWKSKILRRERKNFDSGKLCTPSWVLKIIKLAVTKIYKAGYGVVFSGSPRTLYEAFGTKNNGLIQTLISLYGRENIFVLKLSIREKFSIERNSHRVVCSICGLPLLAKAKIKNCAFCGGTMRRRSLDKPEVIKVRLKEYQERTYPIIQGIKKLGIKLFEINGEPLPFLIHQEIVKKLKLK